MLSKDVFYEDNDCFERSMPLSKIVSIIQGHQITDEEIYKSIGDIPVYTGKNDIKGHWNKSIVDVRDLPCLTYATKAFDGTVTIQTELFDANNTAVMIIKDEYKKSVKLEWLKTVLPSLFLNKATSKEGVSYLNKEIVQEIKIDIPKDSLQEQRIAISKRLEKLLQEITDIELKFEDILTKEVSFS